MPTLSGPVLPTIHLNGTSAETLLFEATQARDALSRALDAMWGAAPNARDYYPQGVESAARAIREFDAHAAAVRAALAYFGAHVEHISDVLDQRRPNPPASPEQGFVNCPTCQHFTASVRGEACGDCHYKPVVVTVDYAGCTFEAKLWLVDDRIAISRDGVWAGKGRWDDTAARIDDCPGVLHSDETISEAVYDLLERRLAEAVAARRA